MRKNVARFAFAIGTAMVLGACGGSQPQIGMPAVMPGAAAKGDSHKTRSFLYMAQCCQPVFSNQGNITVYDLGLTRIARTITKGVSNPSFITVDRAGRLYMTSEFSYQGVVEYDPGSERPSRRIKLGGAWAAVTDGSNNLYVAACPTCIPYGQGHGSVDVYRAGTTTLLRSIRKGIVAPTSVAFDTDGNLYVLNHSRSNTDVLVYAPGSSKGLRRLSHGLAGAAAIALDPSNNLFVLCSPYSAPPSVVEYKAASNAILRTITSGLSSPQAMTVDKSGKLYVANTPYSSSGWVSVYDPGASTPSYEITAQMDDPQLLAVDGEGNLYVGNDYYAKQYVMSQ